MLMGDLGVPSIVCALGEDAAGRVWLLGVCVRGAVRVPVVLGSTAGAGVLRSDLAAALLWVPTADAMSWAVGLHRFRERQVALVATMASYLAVVNQSLSMIQARLAGGASTGPSDDGGVTMVSVVCGCCGAAADVAPSRYADDYLCGPCQDEHDDLEGRSEGRALVGRYHCQATRIDEVVS